MESEHVINGNRINKVHLRRLVSVLDEKEINYVLKTF